MPKLRSIVRGARVALVAAAIVGYSALSHWKSVSKSPAGLGTVLLAATPMLVVLVAVGWRTHRWLALAVAIGGVALLSYGSATIASHLPFVYLLQSISTNVALMLLFGASVRVGHEPLCTRLSAMQRGRPLPPSVERYTRQVTVAWTVFFASILIVSIALFVLAPVDVWSLFANLLYTPLVVLMFVVEYMVRRRVLRDVPHTPFTAAIRAWWTGRPFAGRLMPRR